MILNLKDAYPVLWILFEAFAQQISQIFTQYLVKDFVLAGFVMPLFDWDDEFIDIGFVERWGTSDQVKQDAPEQPHIDLSTYLLFTREVFLPLFPILVREAFGEHFRGGKGVVEFGKLRDPG